MSGRTFGELRTLGRRSAAFTGARRPGLGRCGPTVVTSAVTLLMLLSASTPGYSGDGRTGGRGGTQHSYDGPAGPQPQSPGTPVADTPATFWSLDPQTSSSSGVSTDPAVRAFLNETPFTWFRYGEWTEQCNITANVQYADNGSVAGPCAYNLTALKGWCGSVPVHCQIVLPLPGENNDSREDAFIAHWIVQVVGLRPQFWSIGNEPSLWKHYGIPWSRWSPADHSRATPLAYAVQLRDAIRAVRNVDPGARFVGLEAASPLNSAWFDDVAKLDGGRIAAIGYHSYPFGASVNETLAQFLSPLRSATNITSTYAAVRSVVASACATCGAIPVFLHEFNAGPGNGASPYGGSYANAVFLAASVVQALETNVTQFTVFNLQTNGSSFGYSLMNQTDAVAPTGLLFSAVLSHLVRGWVYPLRPVRSPPDVWGVLTESSTRASVLLVNANLTAPATFSTTQFARSGARGTTISWNASSASPRRAWGPIPSNLTVPSEGIVLIDLPASSVPTPPLGTTPDKAPTSGPAGAPCWMLWGRSGPARGRRHRGAVDRHPRKELRGPWGAHRPRH